MKNGRRRSDDARRRNGRFQTRCRGIRNARRGGWRIEMEDTRIMIEILRCKSKKSLKNIFKDKYSYIENIKTASEILEKKKIFIGITMDKKHGIELAVSNVSGGENVEADPLKDILFQGGGDIKPGTPLGDKIEKGVKETYHTIVKDGVAATINDAFNAAGLFMTLMYGKDQKPFVAIASMEGKITNRSLFPLKYLVAGMNSPAYLGGK